ncbi:DNA adenine methylase [Breznakiellaceae bacterium SP9]
MSYQQELFNESENADFLSKQIISYIGNKRSLLPFIEQGIQRVQKRLNKEKLRIFDVFTGSGVVARHFKKSSSLLLVNDLERYVKVISECYLSNRSELAMYQLKEMYTGLLAHIQAIPLQSGVLSDLYAPHDDAQIKMHERVFYTKRNAGYIDTMRALIEETIAAQYKKYFLGPLLYEASVHSNTGGVFKGFYKNKETGIGQFGGTNQDALLRIKGDIHLPFPVFSNFDCEVHVYNGNSNDIVKIAPEVDIAYVDPPYNQHPYGSNYFMLNVILENQYPGSLSRVSGIPENWNRSAYNKKHYALLALTNLVTDIKAKYVLISFNSDGFISLEEMRSMLQKIGTLEVLETTYHTFRACRNLANRAIHITEYLYLLEK